jgi:predicted metal-dependent peptidase
MATVAGAIDYSYARPSRRQSALGNVIMPSLREPVVRVAIVVDTSGSMSVPDLGVAMREIEKIIKGFGKNDAVPVFSVDAAVRARQRVRNVAEVRLVGGGGTDMREGIEEALMQRPRPDVAIVLTDGYTPWPDIPPLGMRVVAGIIGGTCQGVPGWMRTVLIDASG